VLLQPVVVAALGTVFTRTFRAVRDLGSGLTCLNSQVMNVSLPRSRL
jgi:hypothetical protein